MQPLKIAAYNLAYCQSVASHGSKRPGRSADKTGASWPLGSWKHDRTTLTASHARGAWEREPHRNPVSLRLIEEVLEGLGLHFGYKCADQALIRSEERRVGKG